MDPPTVPLKAGAPRYRAVLLGPFQLVDAETGENVTPKSRKARALLAYLALDKGGSAKRDHMAGLLWGNRGEEQARASLRQTLYELRPLKQGETALIEGDREDVKLAHALLSTDIDRIEDLVASGNLQTLDQALSHWSAPPLADLLSIDSAFDEWAMATRERTQAHVIGAVLARLEQSFGANDAVALQAIGSRLQALDPLNERILRLLLRADHEAGDSPAMHKRFQRFNEALKRELDVAPSAETRRVFQELVSLGRAQVKGSEVASDHSHSSIAVSADTHDPQERTALRRWSARPLQWLAAAGLLIVVGIAFATWRVADRPDDSDARIAVIPFTLIGSDAELVRFGQTLLSEITTSLTLNDVRSVSGEEVAGFGGSSGTSAVTERRVAFLVEGTVTREQANFRVQVHLVTAHDHVVVWSREFERNAGEPSLLSSNVAARIADVAAVALIARREPGVDWNAFSQVLLANDLVREHSVQSIGRSRDLLLKALEQTPNFGFAHSVLAMQTQEAMRVDPEADVAALRSEAKLSAERAIALSPNLSTPYLVLSQLLPPHRWAERESLLRRGLAVKETPRLAIDEGVVHSYLARLLRATGRVRTALRYSQRAAALDPMSPGKLMSVAETFAMLGLVDESHRTFEQAARRYPDHPGIRNTRFEIASIFEPPDAGLALLDSPSQRPVLYSSQGLQAWRAFLIARKARDAAAVKEACDQIAAAERGGWIAAAEAIAMFAALGQTDEGFSLAHRHFAKGNDWDAAALFYPSSAPMRRDRRFFALAVEIGLTDYWQTSGNWPDFCEEPGGSLDCKAAAARQTTLRSKAEPTVQ